MTTAGATTGAGGAAAPARAPGAWRRAVARLAPEEGAVGRIRLRTVAVLRWVAVVGQLFTLLFVHLSLGIELPLAALLPAVALTAAVNLGLLLAYDGRARLGEPVAAILFGYDIAQLVYLLLLTGGLQNPFAPLLLLPVTLAAATLGFRATLALTGVGLLGVAALGLLPGPLPWRPEGLSLPPLYLLGSWTGLSMALILIAIFTWGIAEESRRHAEALAATQTALAREQKLSALGAQAAAAAHLLGSPLGTINVVAKELVLELPEGSPLKEEAEVLLDQARRCGRILASFARRPDPGEPDPFTRAPVGALLAHIAEDQARPPKAVLVRVEPAADGAPEPELVLAPELRHALANLIDNGLRFAASRVVVTVRPSRSGLEVLIEDDGPGFAPEILDWLGEPYVSTRTGEGGMGLGVFIANTLLARTGARLHFDNGTTGARVAITWPREAVERLGRGERA